MNGTRGQYTSAPLNNMRNKRPSSGMSGQQEPKKGGPRFQWLAGIMAALLPILFLLALLIPNAILRWAFLIVTALSLLLMWVLGAFVKNARGTLTVIYCALAVVIGLALFMDSSVPETQQTSRMAEQGALFTNQDTQALGALLHAGEPTPEPTVAVSSTIISAAQQQLEKFLGFWAQSQTNEMLKLCTPSWVEKQASPQTTLFQLTRNSIPLNYQIENVSGSEGDTSRTITLKITLDNRNGTTPVLNRMQVLMFRVNDAWYVDPQSLGGTPINLAAENAQSAATMAASTKAPTPSPAPNSPYNSVKVYYNPDGGKYYHGKSNCPVVSERYWPLTEFNYTDLNTQQFKNMIRCTDPECNAPERPSF